MGDLSKNLSRHEMACKCGCGFDTVDIQLVEAIQDCCDHFGAEMGSRAVLIVTGPNRCAKHNATIKNAAKNSQHIFGRAMDFKIYVNGEQAPPRVVYDYLADKYQYGIGLYSNRVHLDTRTNGPARWDHS